MIPAGPGVPAPDLLPSDLERHVLQVPWGTSAKARLVALEMEFERMKARLKAAERSRGAMSSTDVAIDDSSDALSSDAGRWAQPSADGAGAEAAAGETLFRAAYEGGRLPDLQADAVCGLQLTHTRR